MNQAPTRINQSFMALFSLDLMNQIPTRTNQSFTALFGLDLLNQSPYIKKGGFEEQVPTLSSVALLPYFSYFMLLALLYFIHQEVLL